AGAEYVKRMASGRAATVLEQRGLGGWRAQVDVRDGEQVILRQAYDTGWHATVDGRATTVRADPIGQLAVDVPPGQHVVELDHRVHTDLIAGVAVAAITAIAWSAFALRPRPALAPAPLPKLFGAPPTLTLIAFAALALLGLGLYGTVRMATGSSLGGLVAALGAIGSMATWTWIVNGGVYARVLAAGLAACACWAAARWLRSGTRRSFAVTALLLAAAIASHQVVGSVFAIGIGVATLAHPGPARFRRSATLALATFLLASPAILPAVLRYGGFASAFLGLDRPQLTSSATVLVDPRHVGVALIPLLVLATVVSWPLRRAVALLLAGLVLCLAYLFAPNLGVPSRLYYVNGIAPFTTTFLV